jgi:hypothetical protein
MLVFAEYILIIEAFNIIRKNSNDQLPHKKDNIPILKTTSFNKIKGYDIVKSKHTTDIRIGDTESRDFNLTKERISEIIEKFLTKVENPNTGAFYHLIYKTNNKYNDMVVYVKDESIIIVTILQQNGQCAYHRQGFLHHHAFHQNQQYNQKLHR